MLIIIKTLSLFVMPNEYAKNISFEMTIKKA